MDEPKTEASSVLAGARHVQRCHTPVAGHHYDLCGYCGVEWPCDVRRAVDAVARWAGQRLVPL